MSVRSFHDRAKQLQTASNGRYMFKKESFEELDRIFNMTFHRIEFEEKCDSN